MRPSKRFHEFRNPFDDSERPPSLRWKLAHAVYCCCPAVSNDAPAPFWKRRRAHDMVHIYILNRVNRGLHA